MKFFHLAPLGKYMTALLSPGSSLPYLQLVTSAVWKDNCNREPKGNPAEVGHGDSLRAAARKQAGWWYNRFYCMFLQEIRNYNHKWEKMNCKKLHITAWNVQCKSMFWVNLCKTQSKWLSPYTHLSYNSKKQRVSALHKDTTFKALKIIYRKCLNRIRYSFIFLVVTILLFSIFQNNMSGSHLDLRWKEIRYLSE